MTAIFLITLIAVLINIPFGYIRSRAKRYSLRWFLSIHIPVPLIVIFRLLFHVDYKFIPLFIVASILGQMIGGKAIN